MAAAAGRGAMGPVGAFRERASARCMDAARVGATDPSRGCSVPLPLSNGVCGIFLLSPLCCRKCEVREPQAPAPVLQVTRPLSLPKIPPPVSRHDQSPACAQHHQHRVGITASFLAPGFDTATWGLCVWVGWSCPHQLLKPWSVAGGLPGVSCHRDVGLGLAPEHLAPMLLLEEAAGYSQGQLQEPGQLLRCSFH